MHRKLCCQANSILVHLFHLHVCKLGIIHTFGAKLAPFYANKPCCKISLTQNIDYCLGLDQSRVNEVTAAVSHACKCTEPLSQFGDTLIFPAAE